MTHPARTADYLEHILDAIERAVRYLKGTETLEAFQQHQQAQDAVIRNIEIIGEATTKIQKTDPAFITDHPEIPWAVMRTMRNKVIHDYFDVDLEIVWKTVKNDLPRLSEQLRPLLDAVGPESDASDSPDA